MNKLTKTMDCHTAVLRINVMCKVTVVAPLLTARVAISNIDIQVSTNINEVHMLTVVCVSTSEHLISYHI